MIRNFCILIIIHSQLLLAQAGWSLYLDKGIDNSDNCNNADYLGFVTVDIYKNLNSIPYNDPYSVII